MKTTTTFRRQLRSWLVLSILSVAFGEVFLGSAPFGLLNPVNAMFLFPLYGGQLLILGALIFRGGRVPSVISIWLAGVIFGLYEFYVTKVLWDQPWDDVVSTGLVEGPSLIVVAGFWHPIMSFMIPIFVGEQLLVKEPRFMSLLPARLRRIGIKGVWALLIAFTVAEAAFFPEPVTTLVAYSWTFFVLWFAVTKIAPKEKWDSFSEAMPRGWSIAVMGALLMVVTVVFHLSFNTDVVVSLERHIAA